MAAAAVLEGTAARDERVAVVKVVVKAQEPAQPMVVVTDEPALGASELLAVVAHFFEPGVAAAALVVGVGAALVVVAAASSSLHRQRPLSRSERHKVSCQCYAG